MGDRLNNIQNILNEADNADNPWDFLNRWRRLGEVRRNERQQHRAEIGNQAPLNQFDRLLFNPDNLQQPTAPPLQALIQEPTLRNFILTGLRHYGIPHIQNPYTKLIANLLLSEWALSSYQSFFKKKYSKDKAENIKLYKEMEEKLSPLKEHVFETYKKIMEYDKDISIHKEQIEELKRAKKEDTFGYIPYLFNSDTYIKSYKGLIANKEKKASQDLIDHIEIKIKNIENEMEKIREENPEINEYILKKEKTQTKLNLLDKLENEEDKKIYNEINLEKKLNPSEIEHQKLEEKIQHLTEPVKTETPQHPKSEIKSPQGTSPFYNINHDVLGNLTEKIYKSNTDTGKILKRKIGKYIEIGKSKVPDIIKALDQVSIGDFSDFKKLNQNYREKKKIYKKNKNPRFILMK